MSAVERLEVQIDKLRATLKILLINLALPREGGGVLIYLANKPARSS